MAGFSTEVLREHHDAGEDVSTIAAGFELSESDVLAALAFEGSL